MSELNKLGKVVTTDVLIIGGGTGGVVAGLKLKRLNPELDVMILEQGYYGYKGQSTKAGHGMFYMAPEDDIDVFIEEQVRCNPMGGQFLNDQEMTYALTREGYTYIQELEELGGVFTYEEDGSLHHHREFPTRKNSSVNIDIDFIEPFSKNALAAGVRVMERIFFTDLLTSGGRVVGAVSFHMDTTEFHIFRAKAVVMATNAFNPVITGMFMSHATGMIACYEAGAQLRSPEMATYCDLGFRNTKNFMYGVHWVIHNKLGENVFVKYGCSDLENVEPKLIRGMIEEVKLGNYPLYIDFTKLPQHSETEGEGFTMGILMPNRLNLDQFIFGTHLQDVDVHNNPEISLTMYVMAECLRTDPQMKTTVPGLWGIGSISAMGNACGCWIHGDGVGQASREGLMCAKNINSEIGSMTLGEVDEAQVKYFKDRIYAPVSWKGEALPCNVIQYLYRLIAKPENSINKTEATIHAVLDELRQSRPQLSELIRVPEGDGHHLAKAVEARVMIDMLEIMFMAYDARKESRGFHVRADYTERDDENWLKWIVVSKGEGETPDLQFERIPYENYKYKPDGWTPDSVTAG